MDRVESTNPEGEMPPFCVLEPMIGKAAYSSQNSQNSRLTDSGEQNAQASTEGGKHERAILHQDNSLS